LTASAICGTDLHFVRGTVPGMQEGTVLGNEGVVRTSSRPVTDPAVRAR
jgi:threonine dehydrogenase-like Zn-dependent dehydrogenase